VRALLFPRAHNRFLANERCGAGVMSIDWHPQLPSLVCVGLYDGSVCIFDVRQKSDTPNYGNALSRSDGSLLTELLRAVSRNPESRHVAPVWQVKWEVHSEAMAAKNVNFFRHARLARPPARVMVSFNRSAAT
jgi:hypothetical protein